MLLAQIDCLLEVEAAQNRTHVRFYFNDRPAGVLSLTEGEWTTLRPLLDAGFAVSEMKVEALGQT